MADEIVTTDSFKPDAVEPAKRGRPKKETSEASAPTADEGYSVLTSPLGFKTTVPDDIKDRLIESGYTE